MLRTILISIFRSARNTPETRVRHTVPVRIGRKHQPGEASKFHQIAKACILIATTATATFTAAAPALADVFYVSTTGSNSNPCTLAKPCRSLQYGIGKTPAGGELHVLDSGFYGNNATIKKSLTISGNGHTVYLGSIITVDKAGAVVALRGLVLNGQGANLDGIRIVAAAAVHIERCVVYGFNGAGIVTTATGVELFVVDSISRDNDSYGLLNAGASRLTIDNSRFENNREGVAILSGRATISRSIASGNVETGIVVVNAAVSVMSTTAGQNGLNGFQAKMSGSTMTVDSSIADGNGGSGLVVASGATARISNSTFTGNAFGIVNFGTVETRQNNTVRGNTTGLTGNAPTPIGGV